MYKSTLPPVPSLHFLGLNFLLFKKFAVEELLLLSRELCWEAQFRVLCRKRGLQQRGNYTAVQENPAEHSLAFSDETL